MLELFVKNGIISCGPSREKSVYYHEIVYKKPTPLFLTADSLPYCLKNIFE